MQLYGSKLHTTIYYTSHHPVPARQSAIYLHIYIAICIYIILYRCVYIYYIYTRSHTKASRVPSYILLSHNFSLKWWEGPSLILPILFRISNNRLRLYICTVNIHTRGGYYKYRYLYVWYRYIYVDVFDVYWTPC